MSLLKYRNNAPQQCTFSVDPSALACTGTLHSAQALCLRRRYRIALIQTPVNKPTSYWSLLAGMQEGWAATQFLENKSYEL